ncbi:hypothetical protein [uncultured Rikenella sp.]|uniref:hypothetical protein n=1 Tax=uncultured Rikenella sp. TaxID=368003 RepID=UPI002631EFAE|nr:hypothetical protein [uncultured Rikenella sp.]
MRDCKDTIFNRRCCGRTGGNPAPGQRTDHAGGLYGAGYLGYSWSSFTGSAVGCILLNFGVEWLHTSSGGNRDYGFQLRCLSE